ncbi:PREDICTED: DNA-binding protein Ikaros isoform X1 [Papilio xuthus]|uniref:DNA-binding protein Ikaros n=1 Tax=Papilio xuthus TaxID=66420 RepID=A0A194Q5Y8_PAPXU|nr:PREDICTED: DNA-binding protein Ikaros isoform X1 [Papilio xuthus]XP_013175255.1 PREDICTED: DNA-binding protein Ikaros isoform X1 [Papilio xuthus]XP_013175256.1 PREDICTED: DNA-binding protein Ikaros isoform X1 [Papilio xuthus]KPJ00953.1 DNA-binding protein Ikaros [Papilio xuthus]
MSSKGETEADSGTVSPNLTTVKNEPAATASKDTSRKANSTLLKCTTCNSFSTLSSRALTTHMAQCSPDNNNVAVAQNTDARPHRKLFECDVCNMKFSNGANMRRHKMRHTGVKPYECRVCQKRFFRKDHLAEHFTTHTKSLPYHCPICNRGFQRQIAMRAHFQNEHVGQHDLVKTCPLCSYRAPTMKSLRGHFFNRHGIDLDNPGPGNNSVSLLAAGIANAAYADGAMDPSTINALGSLGSGLSVSVAAAYSDSGDSNGERSVDNATPPMHYLTPHVEISMPDNNETYSPGQSNHLGNSDSRMNGEGPSSPQSGDSAVASSSLSAGLPTNITPSITLIPIKQEPNTQEEGGSGERDGEANSMDKRGVSSSLSSLIKVSPLKSLLREDLRRRISARGRSRGNNASRASPSEGGMITSTHGDAAMMPSSLVCSFCSITFPDSTLYFLHKGCHCDSNPWKCNICGEQCCNVYEFNSHLLSKSHQ